MNRNFCIVSPKIALKITTAYAETIWDQKKRQGLPAKIPQKSAKIRQKPAKSRKSRKDVVCLFQKPAYAVCSLAKFMPKIVHLAI